MEYYYSQKKHRIELSNDDANKILNIDNETDPIIQQFIDNFEDIVRKNENNQFYTDNKDQINYKFDLINNLLREKTEGIRSGILNNYLLNDNLSFLISNGCSLYTGAKAINKDQEAEYIEKIRSLKTNYKYIINSLCEIAGKRPEEILDRLYEIKSYAENIIKNQSLNNKINKLIYDVKKEFVEKFVLTVDYNKNDLHQHFLKRLGFRDNKLNAVNVFTLNYDLLIEKSAEDLGINVNNGFSGFHKRVFMPSTFHLGLHLNQTSGDRIYTKNINLYKLHGSISWLMDDAYPFGIIEKQIDYNDIVFDTIPDCIIYPVQTKKRYSLDLPYSEMFRQFIEVLNRPKTTLVIMGYSFLDEHVNDIITNAIANPDFNLLVFSYQTKDDPHLSPYLNKLFERSLEDSRISIFSGKILGDFEYITKLLLPYPQADDPEKIILKTFQKLKNGD